MKALNIKLVIVVAFAVVTGGYFTGVQSNTDRMSVVLYMHLGVKAHPAVYHFPPGYDRIKASERTAGKPSEGGDDDDGDDGKTVLV